MTYSQTYIAQALAGQRRPGPAAGHPVRDQVRPRAAAGPSAPAARGRPRPGASRSRPGSTTWPAWTTTGSSARTCAVIDAMVRTNFYQPSRQAIALKLLPRQIPELPEPRPAFEIFVYSPRVEGVHLRFGAVARGGLRWSDRAEDFRTEILGLVKAQMVKNTVIVPVGAKGGFYAKRLPDPAVDREAWLAEGVACYKLFIASLLDVTDNIVDGEVVPPPRRDPLRRRRPVPGGGRRQGHRDLLRHRQPDLGRRRLLARRRVRLRRLGRLRPQGDGHHRPRRLGVGEAALPRDGHRLPDHRLHLRRHRAT